MPVPDMNVAQRWGYDLLSLSPGWVIGIVAASLLWAQFEAFHRIRLARDALRGQLSAGPSLACEGQAPLRFPIAPVPPSADDKVWNSDLIRLKTGLVLQAPELLTSIAITNDTGSGRPHDIVTNLRAWLTFYDPQWKTLFERIPGAWIEKEKIRVSFAPLLSNASITLHRQDSRTLAIAAIRSDVDAMHGPKWWSDAYALNEESCEGRGSRTWKHTRWQNQAWTLGRGCYVRVELHADGGLELIRYYRLHVGGESVAMMLTEVAHG